MARLLQRHRFLHAMATDPRLSRADIACGAVLLAHVNQRDGLAWPSYETIAAEARIGTRSAIRSVAALIAAGYFELIAGGGRGHSNRYRPRLETVTGAPPFGGENSDEADTVYGEKGCHPGPETVTPLSRNSDIPVQETVSPVSPELVDELIEEPVEELTPRARTRERDLADDMLAVFLDELGDVLPKPQKLTDKRRKALLARLQDSCGGSLDGWREACRLVKASGFLTGGGPRGWRADLDWLCKPDNLLKLSEGKYADHSGVRARPPDGRPSASRIDQVNEVFDALRSASGGQQP